MVTYIASKIPFGCLPPKSGVQMSIVEVRWFDGRRWVRLSPTEDCVCQPVFQTEEDGEAMDNLDFDTLVYDCEVEHGYRHFVCDVCEIAYDYNEVGFAWHVNGGLMYACKTCLEELGYEYV